MIIPSHKETRVQECFLSVAVKMPWWWIKTKGLTFKSFALTVCRGSLLFHYSSTCFVGRQRLLADWSCCRVRWTWRRARCGFSHMMHQLSAGRWNADYAGAQRVVVESHGTNECRRRNEPVTDGTLPHSQHAFERTEASSTVTERLQCFIFSTIYQSCNMRAWWRSKHPWARPPNSNKKFHLDSRR